MKKLYLALATMALAATLATGCGSKTGNTQADSRTETDSQYIRQADESNSGFKGNKSTTGIEDAVRDDKKNSGGLDLASLFRLKPKINIKDYMWYIYDHGDTEKKHPREGYFALERYLKAYGATEIQYLGADQRGVKFGVKFKNGTIIVMVFQLCDYSIDNYSYYHEFILTSIVVSTCKPDYDFTTYDDICLAASNRIEGLASWSRVFYVDNDFLLTDEEARNINEVFCGRAFVEVDRYRHKGVCSPFYAENCGPVSDGAFGLCVPNYFDVAFNKSVVPYLDLWKAPLDKDPFDDAYFERYFEVQQ